MFAAEPPVCRALALGCTHVGGAGTCVVDANARTREPAEQLRDRLPGDLAEKIPERDVESGIPSDLGAGGPKADITGEILGDPVDRKRIATQELWSDRLVHIGFDGFGQEERFAQSDKPLVGVNAKPEQVCELFEPDRFDAM